MKIFSQDLMSAIKYSESDSSRYVRFSIYGYYLDSQQVEQTDGVTVTITAPGYTQVSNYIDVPLGTEVTYTVSKTNYETVGPYKCTVTGSATRRIQLTNLPMWQFSVVPVPADATVAMVSGSYESQTGTIEVPQGSLVAYSVSRAGMDSYSGSRLVPASEQETSPISISVVLNATISINSITPNDATIMWTTGVGDPQYGLSVTTPCTNTVNLTITKTGYDTYTASYPASGDTYLTNLNLGDITLTPTAYTCGVVCNTSAATVSMWKEENGVEIPNTRQTNIGSVSLTCYAGDDVHWEITKQYYNTISGNAVVDPTTWASEWPKTYNLTQSDYVVAITSEPAEATVSIMVGQQVMASGTGYANYEVPAGTTVTYTASLGGVTETNTVTITGNYSDTLVLGATSASQAELITSSQTITLPYGKYRFLLVGAGAGGHVSATAARASARTSSASAGAGGGGSGYVVIQDITITNTSGAQVVCTVGSGGASGNNGGNTSIVVNNQTYTANGGKVGYSSSMAPATYACYGGDGGSGGGAGGYGGYASAGASVSSLDGANGAYAGGNGAQVYQSALGTTYPGGTGFYNTVKSYENNAGSMSSASTSGGAGNAGRGLVAIASTIRAASYFMSLSNVQALYNSMGGGGGGGATGVPSLGASIPTIYGGPGGGGGGWETGSNGSIPTTGSAGTGGTGGSGAILYKRISWS